MWNQDQDLRFLLSNCISREMRCWMKPGWKIFEFELSKIVKYERNYMPREGRQKNMKIKQGPRMLNFGASNLESGGGRPQTPLPWIRNCFCCVVPCAEAPPPHTDHKDYSSHNHFVCSQWCMISLISLSISICKTNKTLQGKIWHTYLSMTMTQWVDRTRAWATQLKVQ